MTTPVYGVAMMEIAPDFSGFIKALEKEMAGLSTALAKAGSQAGKAMAEEIADEISDEVVDEVKDLPDEGGAFAKFAKDAGKKLGKYLAIGFVASKFKQAIENSVDEAVRFESAFAGVQKTVDGTTEQMSALRDGIIAMSKEIPATTETISSVAEAAGQLGIQTDNVLAFSRVMIDLGESTNLGAAEAATALARFANVTGMRQSQFDRLGSTIVGLGNNFATTEAEIVEFASRLAGAGTQIGLTEHEILGFATALSSVGLSAEAGGTAFSRVFVEMDQAVRSSSSLLGTFAEVSGKSASEFAELWGKDAAGAVTLFTEGLGRIGAVGGDVFTVLRELGLSDIRVQDSLLRISGASDVLAGSLELASDSWRDNTALVEEAGKRYETTASQIEIAQNKIADAARVAGEQMLPAALAWANLQASASSGFSGFVSDLLNGLVVISEGVQGNTDFAHSFATIEKGIREHGIPGITLLQDQFTNLGRKYEDLDDRSSIISVDQLQRLASQAGVTGSALNNMASELIFLARNGVDVGWSIDELMRLFGGMPDAATAVETAFRQMNPELNVMARYAAEAADGLEDVDSTAGGVDTGGATKQFSELALQLQKAASEGQSLLDVMAAHADPVFGAVRAWQSYQETLSKIDADGERTGEEILELSQAGLSLGSAFDRLGADTAAAFETMALAAGVSADEIQAALQGLGLEAEGNRLGNELIDGIISGISGLGSQFATQTTSQINRGLNRVKQNFEIESPSKVFAREVGGPIGEGIVTGTEKELAGLSNVIVDGVADAMDEAQNDIGPLELQVDAAARFRSAGNVLATADTLTGSSGPLVGEVTINNPVGEPSEESLQAATLMAGMVARSSQTLGVR